MPDYAALSNAAVTSSGARREVVRRAGRRRVLRRPAGLRPALRREPVRGRPGHAQGLQRQHDRPAGAEGGPGAQGRRDPQPGRRHLDHHLASSARAWTASAAQRWQQVSRLGMPLVNEVVIPVGKKNEFNATQAARTTRKFLQYVHEARGAEADRGHLQHPGAGRAAQRPRRGLPHRCLRGLRPGRGRPELAAAQQGRRRPKKFAPERAAAAQHVGAAGAPTRTGSASSAATSPASRTVAASPTTSST